MCQQRQLFPSHLTHVALDCISATEWHRWLVFDSLKDLQDLQVYSSFIYIHAYLFKFQPFSIRNLRAIQTSADTTQLQQDAPSDPSTPFTVKLHKDSFQSHQCESPDLDVTVTKDQLLLMYRQMQTMRRMEMAADALYKAKLIRGFCHLAIGQVCLFYSCPRSQLF